LLHKSIVGFCISKRAILAHFLSTNSLNK